MKKIFRILFSAESRFLLRRFKFKELFIHLWSRYHVADLGVGARHNYYKNNIKRAVKAPMPRDIEIEISTKCHLKCVMCERTHWDKKKTLIKDMSLDEFKRIVNMFKHLRYLGFASIGSNVLNKNFNEMIMHCRNKGIFVAFVDSFDIISKETIELCVKERVGRIEISIDAAKKETYESIKVGSKWDKVLENLNYVKEMKRKYNSPFPRFFVRYIVMKQNLEQIPDFVDLISQFDLNRGEKVVVEFSGLLVFPEIEHMVVQVIPKEIIDEAMMRVKKYKNIEIYFYREGKKLPTIESCSRWLQPYIMVDGSITQDCAVQMSNQRDRLFKYALGNVLEEDIKNVWNGEKYSKFRNEIADCNAKIHPLCYKCRAHDTSEREKRIGVNEDDFV